MASRYWVAGGTGDWSSTTNWSTTSGGASGASVPTSADDVFVNALSGTSPAITLSGIGNCLSLDFTGAITPSFTTTQPLNVYGNLIFISTMTVSFGHSLTFKSTSTGKTITSAGKSISNGVYFDGVGGGWTLQDDISVANIITITNGSFTSNNKNITCNSFVSDNSNIRTINLGSSLITVSNNITMTTITNLTFNAGTSTFTITGANRTVSSGTLAFYNLVCTSTPFTLTGTFSFNTMTIASNSVWNISNGSAITVNSLISNGTNALRATLQSGSGATLNIASGTIYNKFMIINNMTFAGGATFIFNLSTYTGTNSGASFLNELYWIGGTGNTNDTAHWTDTTGGTTAGIVPSSTISAKFDANSFNGAGQIVTINVAFDCLDMIWTGAMNNPTLAGSSPLNIYGSLTTISAMTVTFSSATTFRSTTSGKSISTNGISFVGNFIFSGIGGAWTLQDNLSVANITLTSGSLVTNNKNVTLGTFTGSGTGVRSLTLGSSVITLTGTWNFATITNLTLDAGTSSIVMTTNTTSTFFGGGLSYNNATLSQLTVTITGSNTFNILTLGAGKTLKLTSGTTQTVTAFVCNGTAASPSTLQSDAAGSAATIALPAGRYFIRHTSIKDIAVSGATAVTSIAGTNVSGNTGITFVTKFEMGRIKNDGSFNWYSTSTGAVSKVSG